MDALDKQIFFELINNCRISYRDLGKKINLSPSAVKKRMNHLEKSGFIDRYNVLLHPEKTNLRYATLMVYTDASVKVSAFKDIAVKFDGVYLILPLISGNFYVSLDYSKKSDLVAFQKLIKTIPGVLRIELFEVFPEAANSDLPDAPEFTKSELMVLSQLAIDARMMVHDIAANIGWSTKKTRQLLQDLESKQKVVFGPLWNPNLGRDIAFNLIITYDVDTTSARKITESLNDNYPTAYFNSRVVESRSTIFAVFTLERVVDMEPIAMAVLDYTGVQSCYAITYYNAISGKPLSRLRLERILEKEGLWHPEMQKNLSN
ncbi:MAG: winged helix-turn-helix transcriptional regulator [Candidatus Thorarchaeota archaeon]|nr:winged helix-turn-helix transcriptional regulator [Candidatus Thorarchaeota archaeon]